MQTTQAAPIKTWFQNEAEEADMFEDHAYLWRHVIDAVAERNFSNSSILDYGCNRGGFLQTLFQTRPFKQAIGVDIAAQSLAYAEQNLKHLPIQFMLPEKLPGYANSIDVAFSHEVLYLLPDLDQHANDIAAVLKKTGTYYATIGCHTDNPLWKNWRELISHSTNLPVFDYSLDDYAAAFRKAGLQVEMRSFQLNDFVLIKPDNAYFPKATDSLNYHTNVKTIIRAKKVG